MDFNKIKEMGLEYAEKGKNAALDLAEKGRTQAKIVNAQSKLYKAQRQLGALVYSLAKGNEENQPLVDKYIEMIANIEQELSDLKASLEPDTIIAVGGGSPMDASKIMWLLAQDCDSFDQLQQRFYRQINFDTFYH